MNCFTCKIEMTVIERVEDGSLKYEILKCPNCKSVATIQYHLQTNKIKKVDWRE